MRMGQRARTGLGHGGITCVLHTQFSSFFFQNNPNNLDSSCRMYVEFQDCLDRKIPSYKID